MGEENLHERLRKALETHTPISIPDLEEALRHNPHLILTRHEDTLILADRRGGTLAHLTLEGRVLRLSPPSNWLQDYPAWEEWVDAEPPQAQLMEDYWYRAPDPEDF